ncbi:cyclophane-containing peptide 2OG-Fe(II) oxygenase YhhC [Sorangium sp. So ce1335]|uniref:cyclophane-containing peptide 2OG-Fe(II) oxygenase YhhC n=1 Tax=Sorangium sp. So ce1335 TaxID=3133335 RepID=UPI003F64084D
MKPRLLQTSRDPFLHFVLDDFYEAGLAERLGRWLDSAAPWRRAVHHFYDQFELNFRDVAALPDAIAAPLLSPAALGQVTVLAEQLFGTRFRPNVCVGAHKLVDGQGIGLHTDSAPGEETHRIVVQLSRDWQDDFGGNLVFFGSSDVNDVRAMFRHVFNTAVGFSLGGVSYHAVSDVSRGERLTVIYGFWEASSAFDESRNARRTFTLGGASR